MVSALLATNSGVAAMNTGILSTLPVVHDGGGEAVGLGDGVVGLDVDHGVDGLGGHGGHHVVHVHAHFLVVALFQAGGRRDLVDEDVADRGAGLVGDLEALELLDLADAEILARHDARGAADVLDDGDTDEAALVVAEDEGGAGVGAEIHLPRHHLLHGEVAGRHGELLELQPALLQRAGAQQVVGRHAPHVGLVALADGGGLRGGGARQAEAGGQRACAARGEIVCRRVMPCPVVIVSSCRSAFASAVWVAQSGPTAAARGLPPHARL